MLFGLTRGAQIVYEDDKVIAFLDKFPQACLCPYSNAHAQGAAAHELANESEPPAALAGAWAHARGSEGAERKGTRDEPGDGSSSWNCPCQGGPPPVHARTRAAMQTRARMHAEKIVY